MGIQTEQADLRVHVCPKARKLYAFNPTWMTAFIGEHQEFVRTGAGQPGVTGQTSSGVLVPIVECGENMVSYTVNEGWKEFPDRGASTSVKGIAAYDMVARNIWSINVSSLHIKPGVAIRKATREEDICGIDMELIKTCSVQVKCDYLGGDGDGCSGNLYIETRETNPLRRW